MRKHTRLELGNYNDIHAENTLVIIMVSYPVQYTHIYVQLVAK